VILASADGCAKVVGPGDRQSQMFHDVGGGESAKAVKGFGKRSRGYAMQWAMEKGKGWMGCVTPVTVPLRSL
jgi:hypothetical protein